MLFVKGGPCGCIGKDRKSFSYLASIGNLKFKVRLLMFAFNYE